MSTRRAPSTKRQAPIDQDAERLRPIIDYLARKAAQRLRTKFDNAKLEKHKA